MKLSHEELVKKLDSAKQQIEIGAIYRHYKSPDMTYEVKDIVVQEADNEPCVIYQALYDSNLKFARPASVWLEHVEVDGKRVSRFTKQL